MGEEAPKSATKAGKNIPLNGIDVLSYAFSFVFGYLFNVLFRVAAGQNTTVIIARPSTSVEEKWNDQARHPEELEQVAEACLVCSKHKADDVEVLECEKVSGLVGISAVPCLCHISARAHSILNASARPYRACQKENGFAITVCPSRELRYKVMRWTIKRFCLPSPQTRRTELTIWEGRGKQVPLEGLVSDLTLYRDYCSELTSFVQRRRKRNSSLFRLVYLFKRLYGSHSTHVMLSLCMLLYLYKRTDFFPRCGRP